MNPFLSSFLTLGGMPFWELTDPAIYRLQTISFFLVVLLLSTFIIKWLWNSLQPTFPQFPLLRFRDALKLTVLWGLLFVLILTMISGARELMTPGAWERRGRTYQLKTAESETQRIRQLRRGQLEILKALLFAHAAQHSGKFPESVEKSGFPESVWTPGDEPIRPFLYRPGFSQTQSPPAVLVIDTKQFDGLNFKLLTDGQILIEETENAPESAKNSQVSQPEPEHDHDQQDLTSESAA